MPKYKKRNFHKKNIKNWLLKYTKISCRKKIIKRNSCRKKIKKNGYREKIKKRNRYCEKIKKEWLSRKR